MQFVSRHFYIVSHLALLMMTLMKGDRAAVTRLYIPALSRLKTVVRNTFQVQHTHTETHTEINTQHAGKDIMELQRGILGALTIDFSNSAMGGELIIGVLAQLLSSQ